MKLVKTIELNCFGDSQVKEWEKVCKEIENKNNSLSPVIEEKGTYIIYRSDDYTSPQVWRENVPEGMVKFLLSLDAIVSCVKLDDWCNTKYEIVEAGKEIVEVAPQFIPFPEKPEVKLLNTDTAINEIKKVNPLFKIHPYNICYGIKNGYYEYRWRNPKVKSIRSERITHWGYEGEEGNKKSVLLTTYTQVWKSYEVSIYRVYPDRLEIYQADDYVDSERYRPDGSVHYVQVGSGDSTSLESDGFWSK